MRTLLLLPLLLLAACEVDTGADASGEAAAEAAGDAADGAFEPSIDGAAGGDGLELSDPVPVEGAEPGSRVITVKSAIAGDRACYISATADGEDTLLLADFEVCTAAEALTGEIARVTTAPSEVSALSCQGDPACPDTETVDLVVAIESE